MAEIRVRAAAAACIVFATFVFVAFALRCLDKLYVSSSQLFLEVRECVEVHQYCSLQLVVGWYVF